MKRVLRYRLDINDTVQQIGKGVVVFAKQNLWPLIDEDHIPIGPRQLDIWVSVVTPFNWPNISEDKIRVKVLGTGQTMNDVYHHLISCDIDNEIHHIFEMP